jgi:hypothetical protein
MEAREALLQAALARAPPVDLVLALAFRAEAVEDVDRLLVGVVLGRRVLRVPP